MTSQTNEREKIEVRALLHQFIERKIELRAYDIYEKRGRTDGQALDDWLRAEAEVLGGSILSPLLRKRRLPPI